MIRQIYLHGSLAEKFSKEPISLDVDTPFMLMRGLKSVLPGFEHSIREVGQFSIIKRDVEGKPRSVKSDELKVSFGSAEVIHLVPTAEGAGTETVAGAIASYFFEYGTTAYYIAYAVVTIAEIYAMSAISQRMGPSPDLTSADRGSVDQRPSFLFNGPVNVNTPGYPVPLVYGKFRPGSVVISTGVESEQISW